MKVGYKNMLIFLSFYSFFNRMFFTHLKILVTILLHLHANLLEMIKLLN